MSKSVFHEFDEEFQKYLLNKYGDNHWWDMDDNLVIAYYQTNEPRLAVSFSTYHKAIEEVLGRSVWTHQFASRKTLVDMGMYREHIKGLPKETQDLCHEDIVELVNQAWNTRDRKGSP